MRTDSVNIYRTLSPLTLASGSPRRKELLESVGLNFTVCPSRVEEPPPGKDESASEYAMRMARIKAEDIARHRTGAMTLGADTIVVLENEVMGKPTSDGDALRMLEALSGQTHQVITGCCFVLPKKFAPVCFAVSTDVVMRASTEQELRNYIATGEPADKAGAYAIQGRGSFMVTGISGSYTNVVGLPLARVLESLLAWEIITPA